MILVRFCPISAIISLPRSYRNDAYENKMNDFFFWLGRVENLGNSKVGCTFSKVLFRKIDSCKKFFVGFQSEFWKDFSGHQRYIFYESTINRAIGNIWVSQMGMGGMSNRILYTFYENNQVSKELRKVRCSVRLVTIGNIIQVFEMRIHNIKVDEVVTLSFEQKYSFLIVKMFRSLECSYRQSC